MSKFFPAFSKLNEFVSDAFGTTGQNVNTDDVLLTLTTSAGMAHRKIYAGVLPYQNYLNRKSAVPNTTADGGTLSNASTVTTAGSTTITNLVIPTAPFSQYRSLADIDFDFSIVFSRNNIVFLSLPWNRKSNTVFLPRTTLGNAKFKFQDSINCNSLQPTHDSITVQSSITIEGDTLVSLTINPRYVIIDCDTIELKSTKFQTLPNSFFYLGCESEVLK